MGNRISISEDNMKKLAKVRRDFETPDECLKRLFDCSCVKKEIQKQNDDVVEEEP